ncbi:MAG TPA: response regulator [Candidatus Binataceae bacterium]|nr:response regulator [Candidatus Binataceae bacterium]
MKTRAKQVEHPGEPIIVIEDDVLFRRSILRLLEEHGYKPSAYESFRQFQDIATIPQEGCIILDLHLPGTNGLEIQRQLSAIAPSLSIIFLTAFGRVDVSVRAMKNGAVDFLEKPVDSEVLLRTIDQAIERTRTLSRDRVDLSELRRRFERLSEREREVFTRITSGLLNKQAAAELKITEKTVKFHRAHIMRKMEVGSFAELAKMAARLGLNDRRVNQANPLGADGSRNDAS